METNASLEVRSNQNSPRTAPKSMSTKRYSSSLSKFSDELIPEFDPSTYIAGQSLSSILNNPGRAGDSWTSWFLSADPSVEASTPVASKSLGEVSKAEFKNYLESVREPYSRFVDVQEHLILEEENEPSTSSRGDGLAACIREVPSLFFEEDFALEKGSTFQAACPFSSIPQNIMLQERLTQYLDVVEVHLVKEISARSESFFEAQKHLEDLNSNMIEACEQVTALKSTMRLLESDLVDSANEVHHLSSQRDNVLALHDKLKLMSYVNQAVSALRILVASADCTGALAVIDELQNLLEGDELAGLHCFRHLGDQLSSSTESVNSILSADFVRVAILDSKDLQSSVILASLNMMNKLYAISSEVIVSEDEEADLREQLVPVVIGLLRTSKLPAVLKVYKDTLTTDIKTAIKTVVAESLPVLLTRSSDGDSPATHTDSDVAGMNLANKLRSLSPDAFVQLLAAVFKTIQLRLVRAAKIRQIVEEIMNGLQGTDAAEAVAAAFASGAAAVAAAEAAQEHEPSSLPVLAQSVTGSTSKGNGLQLSNISKQFRADVLRENTEALWAACDAAHGRWGKLLGVRSPIHPKLRLFEFVNIYNVTQEFISATEKVGGRLGYNIRGSVHSQAKSFLDTQHSVRMAKVTAVLDQETWVPVDVPDEFQEIVDKRFLFEDAEDGHVELSDPQGNGNGFQSSENGNVEQESKIQDSEPNEESSKVRKGRVKPKTLQLRGTGYYTGNSGLILLKMIADYVDITNALPVLATEVALRVAEILKVFNSRSCHLVLGAGAIQVSGLKSISAKFLALASQTITFFYLLIPEIKKVLFVYVPDASRGLLANEWDRIAQDYKLHRDEIHAKLVSIMKERLILHLKMLPQLVESWNKAEDSDGQPSPFAKSLTKEVGSLYKVVKPLLFEEDILSIFSRVVHIFHKQLAETFSSLELTTPQANQRLYGDASYILACIKGLPSDPADDGLISFIAQKFGDKLPS